MEDNEVKVKFYTMRRTKMIIKITKCSEDHYWYKNKVGNFYKVLNKSEVAYVVDIVGNTDKGQAAVMVGDFEIIKNPYCYHIAYHWTSKKGDGFGSDVLYTDFKFDTPSNIRIVKEHLEADYGHDNIVILNIIKLKNLARQ